MERAGIEPGAVKCSAEAVVLLARKETATLVVVLPLLEGIDMAPLLSYTAVACHLLKQSSRERNIADYVCRLTGIMGEQLGEVFQRPKLCFGNGLKHREALGRSRNTAKAAAGGGKSEDIGDAVARKED